MAWYKEWFGEDYLKVYPHRNEVEARLHIDFLQRALPLQEGRLVLDLGCGNGRHAVELAGRGLRVVCLDLSVTLLGLARRRALEAGLSVPMVRSDMRRLPFKAVFDGVFSFFTSFGYFEQDTENFAVLAAVAGVLKPKGYLLLDYLNGDYTLTHLVPRDERRHNGILVVQERRFDSRRQRVEKKITLKEAGEFREYLESVRVYTHAEMLDMLNRAGFTVLRTVGDWDGRPFDRQSPRMILLCQKGSGS